MKLLTKITSIAAILVLTACAGSSAPPAVGVWDAEMQTPIGAQSMVLTIGADGTGVMSGDQGDQPISGIVMDGNAVSFDAELEAQGQSITLSFSGNVEGDAMTGSFSTPFGDLDVNATRQ